MTMENFEEALIVAKDKFVSVYVKHLLDDEISRNEFVRIALLAKYTFARSILTDAFHLEDKEIRAIEKQVQEVMKLANTKEDKAFKLLKERGVIRCVEL